MGIKTNLDCSGKGDGMEKLTKVSDRRPKADSCCVSIQYSISSLIVGGHATTLPACNYTSEMT